MSTTLRIQSTETQPFILLPTYINGKGPFEFVLDTGAAMSIVSEALAQRIGIEGTEVKQGLGTAGRKIEIPLASVDSIAVGETRVEEVRVGIMKELPKCVGEGVLGYNFLKGFILTIDYGSHFLTLTSRTDRQHQARSLETHIPLRLARPDRPIFLVDVLVNAQATYQFILDTAASQTVVSSELAQRMSLKDSQADAILGAGGTTPGSVGVLESLSIGKVFLRKVTVIVADVFSALSQAVGTKFDGILGFNVLKRFRLEIDYPNERLWLEEQVHTR